ncbi:putative membrane protein [Owenweeksia hongkongensis DSM 17368]|uniref:Putative membrane protein n=1 Tax=Owenweeksia hongkongensis (strain DSM 17368 / CIP 108786 / JCM 12287 / NRRL B-23963 / UST20020801) TaxID=926562 RepID=G8R8K2_OWEHD|nr:trimeric intracellular cation channel family protein [Owenweeksia hongkongensis]AEV31384.1 putative membrane protein [Owenweeksia hongkongensis DSM 17368]
MESTLFEILDTIGIFAFAMSGATLAIKKRFDVFGIFVLAFVTAVGGGTLRDLLIGTNAVSWIRDNQLIYTVTAGAIAAIILFKIIHRLNLFVYIFDAIGLGLFTIAGIEKGQILELNMFMCIALGAISATFGGVLRDILSGEKPMLLTRKEIYASASIAGGFVYFGLAALGISNQITAFAAVLFIIFVRIITHQYDIRMPELYREESVE